MAEKFIISTEWSEATGAPLSDAFDLKIIGYLGRALIPVTQSNRADIEAFIHKRFSECKYYIDGQLLDPDGVLSFFDHGAQKVIVSLQQFQELIKDHGLQDSDRLIVSLEDGLPHSESDDSIDTIVQKHGIESILLGSKAGERRLKHAGSSKSLTVYVSLGGPTDLKPFIQKEFVPIISRKSLPPSSEGGSISPAANLLVSCLSSDRPDGLYTTCVVDERGTLLGLVYSDGESIDASLKAGRGAYKSRKRGLWFKGELSGDVQRLIRVGLDCDGDALLFVVEQLGDGSYAPSLKDTLLKLLGFCHVKTPTCFGPYTGLAKLQKTLVKRYEYAPQGSYTARLFREPKTLQAKIMEEANELCEARSNEEVASEAADLLYFALAKCVATGIKLEDIEKNLDLKSLKVTRRKGDPKPQWAKKFGLDSTEPGPAKDSDGPSKTRGEIVKEAASVQTNGETSKIDRIQMQRYRVSESQTDSIYEALQRPSQRSTEEIINIVKPIIEDVRTGGDAALLKYTHRFEKATSLKSPILRRPFPKSLMELPQATLNALTTSFNNVKTFHEAQRDAKPLQVETMPGVVCSRHVRPIERVGLYVPGGTAVLPSTAYMLGVPAMVAGCEGIVLATPPRSDGTISPEVVWVADRVGAEAVVLAGGAQAVAALAYGTESLAKVDKILGPGNQFVTAAKMLVANDTRWARVAIDMPAGPSEVLVVVDGSASPAFVAADLLSQAEHGADSQVVLIAVGLSEDRLAEIEDELNAQAFALPRVDIVRRAIEHSVTLVVQDLEQAMRWSNFYAPEHLILQIEDAEAAVDMVKHAGSVFIGHWTPESVGDYSAGVNHSLPTYGYARQYSGVNLSSFTKHITSSNLSRDGLSRIGGSVMQLAQVEGLNAHERAVKIRLAHLEGK